MPPISNDDFSRGADPSPGVPPRGRRVGAWVPWETAEAVCRLSLRPDSHWRVFLSVLFTSSRYGGRDAHLGVEDLTRLTGLATRTVKGALSALLRRGFLRRTGRTRRLAVGPAAAERRRGGVGKQAAEPSSVARRSSQAAGTPPRPVKSGFTPKQRAVIDMVLAEAGELLGGDAGALVLPDEQAERLGLRTPTTYGQAYQGMMQLASPGQAAAFTRAVLALRRDERVQGRDLG